jgi:hypothetical protein
MFEIIYSNDIFTRTHSNDLFVFKVRPESVNDSGPAGLVVNLIHRRRYP